MSDDQSQPGDRTGALAAFDTARDRFLDAFAAVPGEALGYLPPGDDYAIGALLLHLQDTMRHYLAVLDLVQAADFGPLDLTQTAEVADSEARHAKTMAARPTPADRQRLLAELAALHETVRQRALGLDAATFARQAPVVYSPGGTPYPTGCGDILGWLSDHYDEHTPQVGQLLASWRAVPHA
jgi:DinB family protein